MESACYGRPPYILSRRAYSFAMAANHPVPKFIRRLMPSASEEELQAATETFLQYMGLVRRIYERITLERMEADSASRKSRDTLKDVQPDV